jgi:diacylglycerol kinase family enzyme
MRLLLIVNPFASSVTARSRVVIQKALAADHDLTVVETHRRTHATRFASDAAKRGLDGVIVLAGAGPTIPSMPPRCSWSRWPPGRCGASAWDR